MTALADQLTAIGEFATAAIADLAITAGQVYKDGNGQVRCAGSPRAIVADIASTSQVSSLTATVGGEGKHKGSGNNKW